ncbi:MAG: carbon-nitrogen hydrolase family protein [Chloroflexota bacterium]|nr:carbon-nitrogen hydrolase family protein [Chloroflexota bacterium]
MPDERFRVALATLPMPESVEDGVRRVTRALREAAAQHVAVVCFPEAYLPGLRGFGWPVPAPDQRRQEEALEAVRAAAGACGVAAVLGMEWETPPGLHNVAFVVSGTGDVLGYQAKNQLPVEEAPHYVPDGQRRLFTVDGVPFGIAICHEGWRYPETVRWAAARGAKIVFHPSLTTGEDAARTAPRPWGDPGAPYYEKAMIGRAVENTVYFASVNYAFAQQDAATSLIGPDGECLAYQPYGQEGLLIHDLDLTRATGFCARRYDPALYPA